ARSTKGRGHIGRKGSRIDFDGDRSGFAESEVPPQQVHQCCEFLRLDDGRRASAEVDFADVETSRRALSHQPDFLLQYVEISEDRLVLPGDRGVATAIPAHGTAKRDVKVERS